MSKKYIKRKKGFVVSSSIITASEIIAFDKSVLEAYGKMKLFKRDKRKEKRRIRKIFSSIKPMSFKF